ncbi:MAG: archease [Nanoarchaeota archaeon]|nr:archease [Nanoarchaeota archaeon]
MKYKFIDSLTSDVLFESYGKDLKELFENSALAMFEVICDIKKVGKKETIKVELDAEDDGSLLYNWLQELIAQVDIREMFFSDFNIQEISPKKLTAELHGESIKTETGKTVVKAVTNYRFNLEKTKKGYKATVSLDI